MNKELIPTLVLISALFGGALYFSDTIRSPFVSLLNNTKSAYHAAVEGFDALLYEHFFQQERIVELQEKLKRYENDHLLMQQFKAQSSDLFAANNSALVVNPNVELVRALSYAKFGDIRKVWLEMEDFNRSRIYGLVYNETAAGIVVEELGKPLALLNGDAKSSYAVFVGENNAPGIIHGNNSDTLTVRFIPTWIDVKAGDEVVTSGLDNLFFKGLKVGKVLSVDRSQGYQNAVITPYYNAENVGYFHIIKRVR